MVYRYIKDNLHVTAGFAKPDMGYFYLKQNSWTDNYYKPLKAEIGHFLRHHPDSELANKLQTRQLLNSIYIKNTGIIIAMDFTLQRRINRV